MAEQLPNIYTFGQLRVDTTPLAALQGKLLAQRQAKDEALNKYFEKQMGSLSREGIYENDVEDYDKSIAELKNYWKQNAQSIKKGGQSKIDFDNRVQEIKDLVYKSKEKKKDLLEANKLRLDGKIDTDDDLLVIQKIEKRIKDPSRLKADGTPYSFKDFSAFVPVFDPNKRKSFFSVVSDGMKPEVEKSIKKTPLPGGDIEETFELSYTPEQLKFMQERAALSLATDKVANNYYQKLKANPNKPENASVIAKLKQAWDNSGLHQGDEMDSPEDFAMADVLLEFYQKPKPTKSKTYNITKASSERGAGKPAKGVDLSEYDMLGAYTESKGVKTKGLFGGLFGGGGKTLVYRKDIDPNDYKLIAGNDVIPYMDNSGNEYFIVDPNTGDWQAENATISASSVARRNLDRTSLAEEKRGGTGLKPGAPIPGKSVSSKKSYNVGGKTFTLEQMKKGASKAKMSLDEYLKSIGAK